MNVPIKEVIGVGECENVLRLLIRTELKCVRTSSPIENLSNGGNLAKFPCMALVVEPNLNGNDATTTVMNVMTMPDSCSFEGNGQLNGFILLLNPNLISIITFVNDKEFFHQRRDLNLDELRVFFSFYMPINFHGSFFLISLPRRGTSPYLPR